MARTHGRIKVEVWDVGSDFRLLPLEAQWAYQMLVSQPGVTMCGTLPYAPKKWAKLAAGLSADRVEDAIGHLEQAWYLIVDRDTDELLIRTFIKHDRPWMLANLVTAARRQFREIESEAIRSYLVERHEWLTDPTLNDRQVREHEEQRANQRASERTLSLLSERTSPRTSERVPHARADTRTSPAPSPTTAPSPAEVRSGPGSTPRATDEQANGLPVEKERLTAELLSEIGDAADDNTAHVVTAYSRQLPEGALAKVLESVRTANPNDRAAYVVGALKGELAERQPPAPEQPRSQVLKTDPERFVREHGHELEPEQLDHLLATHVTDEDERIRLADLAADLRASGSSVEKRAQEASA